MRQNKYWDFPTLKSLPRKRTDGEMLVCAECVTPIRIVNEYNYCHICGAIDGDMQVMTRAEYLEHHGFKV